MVDRINDLHKKFRSMPRDHIRSARIGWDMDKGRAMHNAKNALSKPPKKCEWSPTLRNLAFIRIYWKLCLRGLQENKDYSAAFEKWQRRIQTNDSTFTFSQIGEDLTVDVIRTHFNKASAAFHKCQTSSIPTRLKFYDDLIEKYEGDDNPATKRDSRRKASIVRKTIDGETIRNKFKEIRRTVKPTSVSSLTKILVPTTTSLDSQDPSDHVYHIIQQQDPSDIMWETVIDRDQVEQHLLHYNRDSFRAASESPLGNGLLYDAITLSGLSLASDKILSGMTPCEWSSNDEALREFLASFTVPQTVQDKGFIPTEITHDDVLRGFRSWWESTSTSSSGRHLGLYKSEIQHPVLLDCFVKFLNIAIASGISIPRWSNAVNVLIEKDAGRPRINRLQIVHLFEADFNFFLKLQWGHRLIRRTLSLNLLHDGQH